MPASLQDKVLVPCPHCGHRQREPRTAISTNCRECGGYFRVQEALQPAPRVVERKPEQRRIYCFDCGTELKVAATAESTMCKRCSSYVDLKSYRIANTVSRNFKTKGDFVLETKGYVLNTEALVGDAVIRGRLLGRLIAEGTLTLYSTAEIKGSFRAAQLIVPAGNHFSWKDVIQLRGAEIAGELAASLRADGTVILKSSARLFGDISAKNLVVEEGAVVVGAIRVGGTANKHA